MITLFYKNTGVILAQNLWTTLASAEEQNLKFSILRTNIRVVNVLYKIAESARQLANCILLDAYLPKAATLSCASINRNIIYQYIA